MSGSKIIVLEGVEQLLAAAGQWNDLWERTPTPQPLARAEFTASWIDTFGAAGRLHALVVEQAGRWVAALPLVPHRLRGIIEVAGLPTNPWSASGDLLMDPTCDIRSAANCLVQGIAHAPWPMLWLEQAPVWTPRWQALLAALKRSALRRHVSQQWRVGLVGADGSWEKYEEGLRGNHRRSVRKHERKLDQAGGAVLRVLQNPALDEIDALLRRCFEVEDRSWKGAEGTSALRVPGMFEFYRNQAHLLARAGMLELLLLDHQEKTIAFSYGIQSAGRHYTLKVGYDDAFAHYGPGQQMALRFIRHLHTLRANHVVDFSGPLAPWTSHWCTQTYPVAKIVVGLRGLVARLAYAAYLLRQRQKNRNQPTTTEALEPA